MQINMGQESSSLLLRDASTEPSPTKRTNTTAENSSLLHSQTSEAPTVPQERSFEPNLERQTSCADENEPTPAAESSNLSANQKNQSQQSKVQQKPAVQQSPKSIEDADPVAVFHVFMALPVILGLPITLLALKGVYCTNSWAVFLFGYSINWATYSVAAYIVPEFVKEDLGKALFQLMQILLAGLSFAMIMQSCARGDNWSQ